MASRWYCLLCFIAFLWVYFPGIRSVYSASTDTGLASRRQKKHKAFAQGTEGESVSIYLYLGWYLEEALCRSVPWKKLVLVGFVDSVQLWAELAGPG